jgi:hypothetical protein
VAEYRHRVTCRDTELLEQRRGGMPEVVKPDMAKSRLPSEALERARQIARFDGLTSTCRENPPICLSQVAERSGRRGDPVRMQRLARDTKQRQPASTGRCIDRTEMQLLSGADKSGAAARHRRRARRRALR